MALATWFVQCNPVNIWETVLGHQLWLNICKTAINNQKKKTLIRLYEEQLLFWKANINIQNCAKIKVTFQQQVLNLTDKELTQLINEERQGNE